MRKYPSKQEKCNKINLPTGAPQTKFNKFLIDMGNIFIMKKADRIEKVHLKRTDPQLNVANSI